MIETPPRDWFFTLPEGWDPVSNPDDPLIWIDRESGRMAALVAPHDSCILDGTESMRCVRPPTSKTGYSYAHIGYTRLEGGDGIKTANLGGRVNHAGHEASTSMAQDHYANTATRWARVRYFEDETKNIWAAGALSPGLDPHTLTEIEGSALSGDWRWIEQLRGHEMAGTQLVNVPGFRPAHAHQFVLTAGAAPGQYLGVWRDAGRHVDIVALPVAGPPMVLAHIGELGDEQFDPAPLCRLVATAAIRCTPFYLGENDPPEIGWLHQQFAPLGEHGWGTPGAVYDRLAVQVGDVTYPFPMVGDAILQAAARALERPREEPEIINIDDDPVDSDWLKVFAKAQAMKDYPGPWDEAIGEVNIGPPGLDPRDYIDVDAPGVLDDAA